MRTAIRLAHYLRRLRPDVVQANGGHTLKYAVLAKRIGMNAWPIVYCNIGISSDWLRWPGQRTFNAWLVKCAAFTAAVSDTARDDLIHNFAADPARVRVVRRGVAIDNVIGRSEGREALRSCGVVNAGPVLLHVGSITPEKNHVGLLRIFACLRRSVRGVQLVLVGDGPLRATIEAQIAEYSDIHLVGLRNDVGRLMAGADLLLLPSLTEGIPGVILEAAAQCLPSVAYATGGIPEAVRHGETGCLVPWGDEQAFVNEVLMLLNSPPLLARFGRNAKHFIGAEYSLQRSVDEFEGLYESVHSATGK